MKKGFTLAEIIGVVIILGLIALLTFPQILKMTKKTENDIDEATKVLIYTASRQYTTENINDFPKKDNNIFCITIEDLIKNKFLTTETIKELPLTTKIKISVIDMKYQYLIDNECIESIN